MCWTSFGSVVVTVRSSPILNEPPYGSERSYNGLRLAIALAKQDPNSTITIVLMADAVACAKNGQKTPDG